MDLSQFKLLRLILRLRIFMQPKKNGKKLRNSKIERLKCLLSSNMISLLMLLIFINKYQIIKKKWMTVRGKFNPWWRWKHYFKKYMELGIKRLLKSKDKFQLFYLRLRDIRKPYRNLMRLKYLINNKDLEVKVYGEGSV